jgi:GTP-binding protein
MSIDSGKVTKLIKKVGLGSVLLEEAHAGDIVGIAGLPGAGVTDIICTEGAPYHLPATKIDPPLMGITVSVNTSPLAGKDGTKISFNELKKRL